MADIKPFKPIIYNDKKVDITKVIMPPYDIIKDCDVKKYYESDEYNIIRIDKGLEYEGDNEKNNKYTRAAKFLNEWQKNGILKRVEKDAFYIYTQEYVLPDKTKKEMLGFFAVVKLEEFDKKIIRPHEKTHTGPKEDRLKLMFQTNANTSPILAFYFDKGKKIDSIIRHHIKTEKPLFDFFDEKHIHYRLWEFSLEEPIIKIIRIFKEKQLFIADGHHRYETAINYRNEMRKKLKVDGEAPFDYILMCLISMEYSGVSILPTHRIFNNFKFDDLIISDELNKFFNIKEVKDPTRLKVKMMQYPLRKEIGVAFKNKYYILILKEEEYKKSLVNLPCIPEYYLLNVCLLHNLLLNQIFKLSEEEILKDINYTQDMDEAVNAVLKNGAKCAFLLKPSTLEEVKIISENNLIMPQKSTYFLPKLATGLLINPLYNS
jgi:uncharacterized protein (DUF1015 family)